MLKNYVSFVMKNLFIIISVVLGCFSGSVSAISWERTSIGQGADVGKMVSTVVDRLGRVHVAYVEAAGITGNADDEAGLVYKIRQTASRDFAELTENPGVAFFDSNRVPRYMDMDVSFDLTVQLAVVDRQGRVRVFERAKDATSWTETQVAINATIHPTKGGVSIRSAGNGAVRAGLVFTRSTGILDTPGTAQFVEQIGPGNWGTPVTIFSGAGSGIAARLANTPQGVQGSSNTRRVVVAYDEVNDQVHVVRQTVTTVLGNPLATWSSAEEIVSLPDLTRPDIEYANGQIGVTSVAPSGGVRYHSRRLMNGAAGTSYADYLWGSEFVASADELDPDEGEFFQAHAPLAYDSAGDPMVAYSRNFFAIFVAGGVDVRTKRRVGALGWEESIVNDFPSDGNGRIFQVEGIDLSMSVNGDPALVYRWAAGGDADPIVRFARPTPAPWVIERPENTTDLSQASAPAVARGLNGDLHMVVSGGTGGLLFGPSFSYGPRRLITFSGDAETSVDIPSSGNPFVSNAATVTPDGTVHVVGLRIVEVGDKMGDVIYSPCPHDGPFGSGGLVTEGTNEAIPGALILESDGGGNLYCAYLAEGGGFFVRMLPSGSSTWETFHASTRNTVGLDMAVRGDGGVAVSWFDGSNIKLLATVDPRNGARSELATYEYAVATPSPADTAVVFAPDGRPRIAFPSGGILNYLIPRRTGGVIGLFEKTELANNHLNAVLEMEAGGGAVHIMSHTSLTGGTLKHLRVGNGLVTDNDSFSVPAHDLTRPDSVQSLSTAVDRNGFPVMAVGFTRSFGLLSSADSVLLCRPADGMDRDNDGIPVLLEEAHCLGDEFPHSRDFLARGMVSQTPTSITMSFEFRRPDLFGGSFGNRREFGDFSFGIETSTDLKSWELQSNVTGQIANVYNPEVWADEGPYCLRTMMGFLHVKGQPAVGPKVFHRLSIRRVR